MAGMKRRRVLALAPCAVAPWAVPGWAAPADTLDGTLRWLDTLERQPAVRTTGRWPIGTVLQHLAQSIELSLDGYPAPRSAVFQQTAGAAAFGYFKWKGRMTHGLDEPIPGAPALADSSDAKAGATRLRAAIARFQRHQGPLAPHFAYGALSRSDYAVAHALHIANHRDEIAGA